jgi:hypothetical protein
MADNTWSRRIICLLVIVKGPFNAAFPAKALLAAIAEHVG